MNFYALMENLPNRYFFDGLPRPAQATDDEASDESVTVTPFHTRRISENRLSSQSSHPDFESQSNRYEVAPDHEQSATYIWQLFAEDAPWSANEAEFHRLGDSLSGAGRHSDSDSGTSADWNYDRHTGGPREDSDWDDIDETQEQRETQRSFWAQSFLDAKLEVRRLFLYWIAEARALSPGIDSNIAWALLVARCQREAVFESYTDVSVAWKFAFDQPARDQFHTLYNGPLTAIFDLW